MTRLLTHPTMITPLFDTPLTVGDLAQQIANYPSSTPLLVMDVGFYGYGEVGTVALSPQGLMFEYATGEEFVRLTVGMVRGLLEGMSVDELAKPVLVLSKDGFLFHACSVSLFDIDAPISEEDSNLPAVCFYREDHAELPQPVSETPKESGVILRELHLADKMGVVEWMIQMGCDCQDLVGVIKALEIPDDRVLRLLHDWHRQQMNDHAKIVETTSATFLVVDDPDSKRLQESLTVVARVMH